MRSIFERLRARRLASAFVVLATLTAAIVLGSYAAHGVRGQEQQNASNDASPLKIVNSPVPPNDFVKIARQVGPAVVNINTQTLPKQSDLKGHKFHGRTMPMPAPGSGDDDDQGQQPGQGQGDDNFQDFFNRFFGGQAPGQGGDQGEQAQVQESLGRGSLSIPRATSLRTTT